MAPGIVGVTGLVGFFGGIGVVTGNFSDAVAEHDGDGVREFIISGDAKGAVQILRPIGVVRSDGIDGAHATIHDGVDRLSIFIGMIEAEGVTQFVDGDALQVDDSGAFHAAVGVPRIFCVKDNIGLGASIAAVPCGGDRQRGIAESLAKNISGKGHFI